MQSRMFSSFYHIMMNKDVYVSRKYTVCLKKLDPITSSNKFNKSGSISTIYGVKNGHKIFT